MTDKLLKYEVHNANYSISVEAERLEIINGGDAIFYIGGTIVAYLKDYYSVVLIGNGEP